MERRPLIQSLTIKSRSLTLRDPKEQGYRTPTSHSETGNASDWA